MKQFYCIGTLLLAFTCLTWGQTMTLSGTINAPNSVTFAAATAGDLPISVFSSIPPTKVFSTTAQAISYSWPSGGNPDDPNSYFYGNISVNSSVAIPSGLQWTILPSVTGKDGYGVASTTKTLGTADQILISGIWSTRTFYFWGTLQTLTNRLTQNLIINNFADLHPTDGTQGLSIIVSYTLQ